MSNFVSAWCYITAVISTATLARTLGLSLAQAFIFGLFFPVSVPFSMFYSAMSK